MSMKSVFFFALSASALAFACASTGPNDSSPPGVDSGSPETSTSTSTGGGNPGSDSSASSGADASNDAQSATGDGSTGEGGSMVGPGTYALNPPKQCDNQFFVPNCVAGDSTSACGGTCAAQSACEGTKPGHPDIGFLCPRFILFADEMVQAAKDDWGTDSPVFNYAVVGHDPDSALDTNGTDGNRSCCECYQLVFDIPNEPEADVNGQASGPSAVAVPPPLIVQAFNTAAGGGKNFDVYMGAGGFGGNNACDPNFSQTSSSGEYLYTSFPEVGEGGNGGEKAAIIPACRTNENLITSDTLSASACQGQVASDCGMIASRATELTNETIHSCEASNDPSTFYHLNWQVFAKRIECPTHLTQVTGCELASQGLPQANPAVTTAAQAQADSSFASGYTTTTMQDCCKPTCAWQDNVKSAGPTVGLYNSFYTCDQTGVPVTE